MEMMKNLDDLLNSSHVLRLYGLPRNYQLINRLDQEYKVIAQFILQYANYKTLIWGNLKVDIEEIAKTVYGSKRGRDCGQINRILEGYRRRLFSYKSITGFSQEEFEKFSYFHYGFGIIEEVYCNYHISGYPFAEIYLNEYFRDAILLDKIIAYYGSHSLGLLPHSEIVLCELFRERLKIGVRKISRIFEFKWKEFRFNPLQHDLNFEVAKEYLQHLHNENIIIDLVKVDDEAKILTVEFKNLSPMELTFFGVEENDTFFRKINLTP
ncbi:hypothetical protein DFR59_11159 [Falsibacillus pallidus]|uniref:Uncharacterized protein n=2 Tax=Falsibacillus pallidus TaxID=493781 RepID=A0A370GCK4_9BACI|nr:hypothetical protein DFR59_11159 [Falsibacillus pallidus]